MEQRKAVGYIRTAVYDADGSNIKNQESAIFNPGIGRKKVKWSR